MREVLAALLLIVSQVGAEPVSEEELDVLAREVVLVPVDGTRVALGDRVYGGTLTITAQAGRLGVVEEATLDQYLMGIREVPFSWEMEALRAQAVAARTYLAYTLQAGRSSDGRRYGYDICATSACQVYAGVQDTTAVERWREAVTSTEREIMLYGGRPALAVYSSTSGGRTRNSEDVFGSDSRPYLRAVDSPGEESPFVDWGFTLEQTEMDLLLGEAGVARGEVLRVETEVTEDGEGPWLVEVISEGGRTVTGAWELRGRLNRAAREVMPDVLPARRLDDPSRRYPQSFLSPSYTISSVLRFVPPDDGPPTFERYFRVQGKGWGHLVGMSQYGAQAMAGRGSGYEQILAHFYSGLEPVDGGEFVPQSVRIGLLTGVSDAELVPDGPVAVVIDGEPVVGEALGSWNFAVEDGRIRVSPPTGLGLPPEVEGAAPTWGAGAVVTGVGFTVTAPAEVRVVLETAGVVVSGSSWRVFDAGRHVVPLTDVTPEGVLPGTARLRVEARNPEGTSIDSFLVIGRGE